MLYKRAITAYQNVAIGHPAAVFHGNCSTLIREIADSSISLTMSSPPYCMGKEYEKGNQISDFIAGHRALLPEIVRITKPGGSICWQVGYHVQKNRLTPLDYLIFDIMREIPDIQLRNRMVWTFGSGLHCSRRFSGRHEVILWFTKGDDYLFNLDAVRVPQKYPGKKASRGDKKGQFTGNPLGKNPSDVWDIPNVKARHVEKTEHPCQFPVALVTRCVRAFTEPGDIVFDPFSGVASTGVAAVSEGRRFLGAEMNRAYAEIGLRRLTELAHGEIRFRPLERAIYQPSGTDSVSTRPAHFRPHEDVTQSSAF